MKRFLVFSYPAYYPKGGWNDYDAEFDTEEEAIIFAQKQKAELLAAWSDAKYFTVDIIDTEIKQNIYSK